MTFYEHEAKKIRLDIERAKLKGFSEAEIRDYETLLLLDYDPKPRAKIQQLLTTQENENE